jgi:hypothetical protein
MSIGKYSDKRLLLLLYYVVNVTIFTKYTTRVSTIPKILFILLNKVTTFIQTKYDTYWII